EALDTDKYADEVRHDFAEARAIGVTGVPFFVLDRKYGISGAQPAEVFSQALEQAWQEANPLTMVAAGPDDAEVCGPDGCAIYALPSLTKVPKGPAGLFRPALSVP